MCSSGESISWYRGLAAGKGVSAMIEWLGKPFQDHGWWSRRELLRAGAVCVGGLMLPQLLAG